MGSLWQSVQSKETLVPGFPVCQLAPARSIVGNARKCYKLAMSISMPDCPAAVAAFILQDRKRLPARFFAALSGTRLSRLA